jgi:hypothetical protein
MWGGDRINVEQTHKNSGGDRRDRGDRGGDRDRFRERGRGPSPNDECFTCRKTGHW